MAAQGLSFCPFAMACWACVTVIHVSARTFTGDWLTQVSAAAPMNRTGCMATAAAPRAEAFSSGPADARTGSMRPRPAPRREHSGRPISRGGGVPTPHFSRPRPEVGLPLGPVQKETALPINRRSRAAAGRCGGSCPGPKGPQRVPAQSPRPHRQRGAEGLL